MRASRDLDTGPRRRPGVGGAQDPARPADRPGAHPLRAGRQARQRTSPTTSPPASSTGSRRSVSSTTPPLPASGSSNVSPAAGCPSCPGPGAAPQGHRRRGRTRGPRRGRPRRRGRGRPELVAPAPLGPQPRPRQGRTAPRRHARPQGSLARRRLQRGQGGADGADRAIRSWEDERADKSIGTTELAHLLQERLTLVTQPPVLAATRPTRPPSGRTASGCRRPPRVTTARRRRT